jgi:hypothetical protein
MCCGEVTILKTHPAFVPRLMKFVPLIVSPFGNSLALYPEFDLENAHYGSLEAIRGVDFA